jgi:acetylornithine/succinyldiaminopimelate/putrescine aminotransferase/predicted amino acid dehydrogenase
MKFAFLVHPLNELMKALEQLDGAGGLRQGWGKVDLFASIAEAHRSLAARAAQAGERPAAVVRVADELKELVSATGARAEGRLYEVPMHAFEIIDDPQRAVGYLEQAVDDAAQWGASLAGLGSMTAIVGGQGTHLAQRGPLPVTTGNSLTVYATLQNLRHAAAETGLRVEEETVAVVGVPGSIATALASALAGHCRELLLVARRPSPRVSEVADRLGATLLLDIPEALARARVVLTATSSGNCIDPAWLRPGSIVLDVAVPTDVRRTGPPRPDVLVLSAGFSRLPDTMARDSRFLALYGGVVPSCLGETLVLALEGRAECFSVGRQLSLDRVEEIGRLAERHGLDFSHLTSGGLPVEPAALARFRKALARGPRPVPRPAAAVSEGAAWLTPPSRASRAARLHARYINPVLAALGGLTRTFVRGEGAYLYDEQGRAYLDFVAGYGSLNLGHNHPAVVEAVEAALRERAPGFTPSAIHPLAAALAEELVALAPVGLDMVFFTSSGAESVEAALKLARAVTGRPGLLCCEGGFHGKTFGALSVTSRARYQRPFGPLLPGASDVPYGDVGALEQALAGRQQAAFIVEPIQGEGGMNVPPPGYLAEAQRLCRRAGTLLIVDEVQTGLGRTGDLFAIDREAVEPDVLTLAKSLGGGLVPLGAMLARRDLWLKAYGTMQTFALHTSTFSGGSLASAAGLAALRALADARLLDNVRRRGRQLEEGLADLCRKSPLVRAVRGRGLMLGVEFLPLPRAVAHHFKGMDQSPLTQYLVPDLDEMVSAIPAAHMVHALQEGHGIYTQLTRSSPHVMRVQPPLTVTEEEAARFLGALEQACAEGELLRDLLEPVLTRSIGEHRPG